ncbi:hypothetical protein SAMN05216420_11085 [Nitrosospira sp. Nl5]|nr:hypothetical protein SAMN05216420_11085 [Nitrosospira sp. Nl5]
MEQPAFGQVRVSNELRKKGIFISPSGVRSVSLCRDLESFKKRLAALERHVAETGGVLTEAQVSALEKKQDDDVARGEVETAHPSYLGSQDTFYVGTIKGVGRIYQQTFVDTYSKWAAAKLYTTKTPITGADLLNDRVLPFLAVQGIGLIRLLTDRGTECCGKLETHDYQLYLALNVLSTPGPRPIIRRPTGSVSVSTRRSCKSFTRSRFGARYTGQLRNCKLIWMTGCIITMMTVPIRERCAAVAHPSKH